MDERTITAVFGPAPSEFKKWDRVTLPPWFRKTKRQGWVNIVLGIYPEKGYVFMTKALQSGQMSEDRLSHVYWPYKSISSLRKFDNRKFTTDCSNEQCLYHELEESHPKMICPRCESKMDIIERTTT